MEATIRVDCDPADVDDVTQAVLADLTDLLANGPTEDEFAIAQEQVVRRYELMDNHGLASAILFSAYRPEEPLLEIVTRYDRALAAQAGHVWAAAREVITLDAYILVRLVPLGFTG